MAAAAAAHPLTRRLPAYRRADILHQVARRILTEQEFLARVLALEAGNRSRGAALRGAADDRAMAPGASAPGCV